MLLSSHAERFRSYDRCFHFLSLCGTGLILDNCSICILLTGVQYTSGATLLALLKAFNLALNIALKGILTIKKQSQDHWMSRMSKCVCNLSACYREAI